MMIKKIAALYYSATGNTKKVVSVLAKVMAESLGVHAEYIDLTLPVARKSAYEFQPGTLVLAGTPIYAGRVPNKILPFFQEKLTGNGAIAIPIVTFGNRSFDNGLIELRNELEAHGFHTVAGAAVPAQHGFSALLATGRPNEEDFSQLNEFGRKVIAKISAMDSAPAAPITVPGNGPVGPYYTPLGVDGKPAVFLKAKPKTDPIKCNGCGLCAGVCPMGSISFEHCSQVDGICIKCQACVKVCPTGAKYFDDEAFLSHVKMLEENYTRRSEGVFCL